MCGCGFKKFPVMCNYRICPECGEKRSFKFEKKYLGPIKKMKIARSIYDSGLRFLTLTIVNQKSIEEGIDYLYESFRRFNRRNYFKEKVSGGIGSIEIKDGVNGLWNLHIHLIIDSTYLDMKSHLKTGEDTKLVKEWEHCTKGSGILYLERVRDHRGALKYVLKYLTKGISDLSPELKASFFKQIFGRRLLFTFGRFLNMKGDKDKFFCRDCGIFYRYIIIGSEEYELSQNWFDPPSKPPANPF